MTEAVKEGLDVLGHLGVTFPSKATKLHIVKEYLRTKSLLRGKTDQMILRKPLMENPDEVATVHMLNLMFSNALHTNPSLAILIIFKLIQLTMVNGLTTVSAVGFAMYGPVICLNSRNKEEGFRYGQLALALLDKFQAKEWIPRVYVSVYGDLMSYKRHLRESCPYLKHAHSVGLETGDYEVRHLFGSNNRFLIWFSTHHVLAICVLTPVEKFACIKPQTFTWQ